MLDNDTTDSHFKLSKARDLTALIKGEMDLISEISPHDILENMELFKDFVVFFLKVHGLSQIRIQDLRTGEQSTVELPEPICRIEKSTESVRTFFYSSTKYLLTSRPEIRGKHLVLLVLIRQNQTRHV